MNKKTQTMLVLSSLLVSSTIMISQNVEATSTKVKNPKSKVKTVKKKYNLNASGNIKENVDFKLTNEIGINQVRILEGKYKLTDNIESQKALGTYQYKSQTSINLNFDFYKAGNYTFYIVKSNGVKEVFTYKVNKTKLESTTKPSIQSFKNKDGKITFKAKDSIGIKEVKYATAKYDLATMTKLNTAENILYSYKNDLKNNTAELVTSKEISINETKAGIHTFYVKDVHNNEYILHKEIKPSEKVSPVISLTPDRANNKYSNKDVTVKATVTDASGVKTTKYLEGKAEIKDFKSKGTTFKNTFKVKKNGTYTVYALDNAGNVSIKTILISNIDKELPKLLSHSYNQKTKELTVKAKDNYGISYITVNGKTVSKSLTAKFTITKKGNYNVIVGDTSGNVLKQKITIK